MKQPRPLRYFWLILALLMCVAFWTGFITYVVPTTISKLEYSDKISIGGAGGLSGGIFDPSYLGSGKGL